MPKNLSGRPELESNDLERFQVHSRIEIIGVLRALHAQRALVTLYLNPGQEFILTTLLSINTEFEEMVFDAGPDHKLNARLTDSTRITGVAFVDSVKIQFNASRVEDTVFEGSPAFRIRLPDSMLRLQRRNFYRIPTPIAKPLRCTVACPEHPEHSAELVVVELGCGGLGVTVDPAQLQVDTGARLEQFTLALPDEGTVQCALIVRHIYDASKGAIRRHRLGCEFVDLPSPAANLVQRYVNKIDRERRTK